MRLFAALIPPPQAVADLERHLGPRRAAAGENVRWSAAEQWHLTLAFLARVDDDQVEPLTAALRGVAGAHAAPRLRIAGAGAFPRARRARVVWAGLQGDDAALAALAALAHDVTAAAVDTGIEVPDAAFRGHLTLARLRTPGDVTSLLAALDGYAGPPWAADAVALVESQLGKGEGRRSRYVRRATLPLR